MSVTSYTKAKIDDLLAGINTALGTKVNSSTYVNGLTAKADLVSGTVPDGQIPDTITRDSELLASINDGSTPTGAALRAAYGPLAAVIPSSIEPDPAVAKFWKSSALRHVRADPAIGARSQLFNFQEPASAHFGGKFHLLVNGGTTAGIQYRSCPDNLDPLVAANWTAPVAVMGSGTPARNHGSLYIEGTTAYYYYARADDQQTYVSTADVSNMLTWTDNPTPVAPAAGNLGSKLAGNSFVVKDGSTYYMFLEASYRIADPDNTVSSDSYPWMTFLATATSPLGPFTVPSTPLMSLRVNGLGSVSGAWITRENGVWGMYLHSEGWGRMGTPTDIYRAANSNIATDTWTFTNGGRPIYTRAHEREVDQVADPDICLGPDGAAYMFYTAINNMTGSFQIMCTRLLPTLMRRVGSSWVEAEPIQSGEDAAFTPFLPRVTQNTPMLDPAGESRIGTWALATTPAGMYGGVARQNTSAASGNAIDFDVMLAPGAYSLAVLHPKGPDRGILTAKLAVGGKYFNLTIGTIDQYAAAESVNNRSVLTFTYRGPKPAVCQLRFIVSAKNTASSGFTIADQGWQLTRTDRGVG